MSNKVNETGFGQLTDKFSNDMSEFAKFAPHFNEESLRGSILISCSFIEKQLQDILSTFFQKGETSKELFKGDTSLLGSLSAKAKIAYCIGLIEKEEFQACVLIGEVRNIFAHNIYVSFADKKVQEKCEEINGLSLGPIARKTDNYKDDRARTFEINFMMSVLEMIAFFTQRTSQVEGLRLEQTKWRKLVHSSVSG